MTKVLVSLRLSQHAIGNQATEQLGNAENSLSCSLFSIGIGKQHCYIAPQIPKRLGVNRTRNIASNNLGSAITGVAQTVHRIQHGETNDFGSSGDVDTGTPPCIY